VPFNFAKAGGARVISVVRASQHAEQLCVLGASEVIVTDEMSNWPARVMALTNNAGADSVVNVAGGTTLAQSIACTRIGATTHLIGYAADTSAQLDIFDAIRHGALIRVAAAGSRASFEKMVKAIEVNKIRPAISKLLPLAQVHEALAGLAEGGHLGKVVLSF
jgi:NADPH:quinone reductase-like Zn-dependent oxidoreductase